MVVKATRAGAGSRSAKRPLPTSLDSHNASDSARDMAKSRKVHASTARANKSRASMACERCKHKKVKCEDYIDGQGCEKCRGSNEICYFHKKEVEIKTSFRQGYVENCERECDMLKELVWRMYKERVEGRPNRVVDSINKDGNPNMTSLMHFYGVGLGEDFMGTYEARDAKLAAEGQPMLVHNGKGDIQLPQEDSDAQEPRSPESMDNSSEDSTGSRSPSIETFSPKSAPSTISRKSSAESLFSDLSSHHQHSPTSDVTLVKSPTVSLRLISSPRKTQMMQNSRQPLTPTSQDCLSPSNSWMLPTKPSWAPEARMDHGGYSNVTQSPFQGMPPPPRRFSSSNNVPMNAPFMSTQGLQLETLFQGPNFSNYDPPLTDFLTEDFVADANLLHNSEPSFCFYP